MQRAAKVVEEAAPELVKAVEEGRCTVNVAMKAAESLSQNEQMEFAAAGPEDMEVSG